MKKKKHQVRVFIEQRAGKAADVSFDLLSNGHKLAESLHGELKAVLFGHKAEAIAQETFRYGASEVLMVDHPELEHYNTLPPTSWRSTCTPTRTRPASGGSRASSASSLTATATSCWCWPAPSPTPRTAGD